MTEKTVGIRELKENLSRYIGQVKEGVVIEVTERGKTVGRIVPAGLDLEEKMRTLQRSGIIRWNGRKPKAVKPVEPLGDGRSIASIIVEDR